MTNELGFDTKFAAQIIKFVIKTHLKIYTIFKVLNFFLISKGNMLIFLWSTITVYML